jgi:hypothetical protein
VIDTTKGPGWYFKKLTDRLAEKQTRLDGLMDYLEGDAPLPEGAESMRAAYRAFQQKSRTNFAEIVVEAVQERMSPTGFVVGDQSNLDDEARRIWSVNEMDTAAADVHNDMLGLSEGFVMVGAPDSDGVPIITREDPRMIATMQDPVRPNKVIAALKVYTDELLEKDLAYLYLPGYVFIASRPATADALRFTRNQDSPNFMGGYDWDYDLWVNDGKLPVKDAMPIVRFPNRRALGEFETHTDILDRINYMLLQRLVITAMQAFRQRATKGEMPETDEQGDPIDYNEVFRPGPGALWMLPEGVDLWESQTTDIQQILNAVKDDVRDLAAVTRTPMAMLLPEGQNQSAEGASFAREGLVFKTRDRIKRATYGWNTVMSLALRFAGQPAQNIETLWLPPERLSLTERADAAVKLKDIVPRHTLWTDIMQFTPEKAERMESEMLSDILSMTLGENDGV